MTEIDAADEAHVPLAQDGSASGLSVCYPYLAVRQVVLLQHLVVFILPKDVNDFNDVILVYKSLIRVVKWLAADELKIGWYLWLFLLSAEVRREDEIAVRAKVDLLFYFELDGDLRGDLVRTTHSIFSLIEDIFDEFKLEGIDLVECRLVIEDEEVLETADDEVEIIMALPNSFLYLVSDLFEEVVDLTKIYMF